MRMMIYCIILFLFFPSLLVSEITTVNPSKNINEIIINTEAGDTLILLRGIYEQSILIDKPIFITSAFLYQPTEEPIRNTIIRSVRETAITIKNVSQDSVVILGLTIDGGFSQGTGAGFTVQNSLFLFKNLIVTNCDANGDGGGGIFTDSRGAVLHTRFEKNRSSSNGGHLFMTRCDSVIIEKCVFIEGEAQHGGAIHVTGSSIFIKQSQFLNNIARQSGGALSALFSSYLTFETSRFSKNNAGKDGGGIYINSASLKLINVAIHHNISKETAGGIYINNTDVNFAIEKRSNIYLNNARKHYDIYYFNLDNNSIPAYLDTFSVKHPNSIYASLEHLLEFNINEAIIPQPDGHLVVDPSTTSQTAPTFFSKISEALKSLKTSPNGQTVLTLKSGIYSPSQNGEHFPLVVPSHVKIAGEAGAEIILDAETTEQIFYLDNVRNITLTNMRLTGGMAENGAGIFCSNLLSPSDTTIVFDQLSIHANTALHTGGGIYLESTTPVLTGLKIYGNAARFGGGVAFIASQPLFAEQLSTICFNQADFGSDLFADFNTVSVQLKSLTGLEFDTYAYPPELFSIEADTFCTTITAASEIAVSSHSNILLKPYPNPGSENITIPMRIQQTDRITMTIFDALGRTVKSFPPTIFSPGLHNLQIPLDHFGSGTYFFTTSGEQTRAVAAFTVIH